MERLGALFHWAPRDRREAIEAEGLRLHQAAVCHSDPSMSAPYLSLGASPRGAWSLSGDLDHVAEVDEWDCWQVHPIESDDLRVRAEYGPTIREVKAYNAIPADRLWLVGTREIPTFRDAR